MDILTVSITKIHSVQENKRTVWVVIDTDCYGGKEEKVACGFFKDEWKRIKQQMCFLETKPIDSRGVSYFENMTDAEWYERKYAAKLKDFTDEEIVEEFNRRLENKLFHHIAFVGQAEVVKR